MAPTSTCPAPRACRLAIRARVVDGDTVVVAGVTVRLKGVDAAPIVGNNGFAIVSRTVGKILRRSDPTAAPSITAEDL